jgi:hypothetical protein
MIEEDQLTVAMLVTFLKALVRMECEALLTGYFQNTCFQKIPSELWGWESKNDTFYLKILDLIENITL